MKCVPPPGLLTWQPEQGEVCFFVFFEAIYPRSNMAGVYTAVAEISAPVLGKGGGGGHAHACFQLNEQREVAGLFLVPMLLPGCS